LILAESNNIFPENAEDASVNSKIMHAYIIRFENRGILKHNLEDGTEVERK